MHGTPLGPTVPFLHSSLVFCAPGLLLRGESEADPCVTLNVGLDYLSVSCSRAVHLALCSTFPWKTLWAGRLKAESACLR